VNAHQIAMIVRHPEMCKHGCVGASAGMLTDSDEA